MRLQKKRGLNSILCEAKYVAYISIFNMYSIQKYLCNLFITFLYSEHGDRLFMKLARSWAITRYQELISLIFNLSWYLLQEALHIMYYVKLLPVPYFAHIFFCNCIIYVFICLLLIEKQQQYIYIYIYTNEIFLCVDTLYT